MRKAKGGKTRSTGCTADNETMDNLKESTDEALMREYQEGNDRAFEVLYSRHSSKIYGFLKRRLNNQSLTEDVFQATFLKLHTARSHYDPSFPFIPWLFTVCRSVMVDSIRKQQRTLEDLDAIAIERAVSPLESSEETATGTLLPDLTPLPANQRQAILLRYGEDLSFQEIARRLQTSPTNVRKLVSRGIGRLKGLVNGSRGAK